MAYLCDSLSGTGPSPAAFAAQRLQHHANARRADTAGFRTSDTNAIRGAFIRRAADENAVGRSRLLEPREGAEMAQVHRSLVTMGSVDGVQLNLNYERSARREEELKLMMHSRMIPLAQGRDSARLSLLDSTTQRCL